MPDPAPPVSPGPTSQTPPTRPTPSSPPAHPTPPANPPAPPARPPLTTERHLDAIAAAAHALADDAAAAGLNARVPTCPRWRVADLVAHQGMVHRWAAGILRADDARVPSKTEILRTVPRDRLLAWFADGAAALHATLVATPPDADTMVFLKDAPPPRAFWARRQAHETTIHAVDALAAGLARLPTADEAALPTDLAVDGIDELLTGFVTRGRNKLCGDAAFRLAVVPDDGALAWVLDVAPDGITTHRTTPALAQAPDLAESSGLAQASGLAHAPHLAQAPDAVFRGTAAQLYLGLWNRGDEVTVYGDPTLLTRWSTRVHVTWS